MTWDMPIRPIESGPLTDREINELHRFLLAEDGRGFLHLRRLHLRGAVGPNTIMPSEWLRWVWDQERGEQPPEFRSEKQAKRILSLLIGHANVLAFTLIHGPQHYEPCFTASGGVAFVTTQDDSRREPRRQGATTRDPRPGSYPYR
jgi:yecA family protein